MKWMKYAAIAALSVVVIACSSSPKDKLIGKWQVTAVGVYNLPLNGDSLAVGVYLVRLQIGSTKLINKIASKIASAGIEEQQIATFTAFPNPVESVLNIPQGFY